MNKREYEIEIVKKEDVLNQTISLNDDQALFAIYLDDGGEVNDLEYQTISSIKEMIEDGSFMFLKRTEIQKDKIAEWEI